MVADEGEPRVSTGKLQQQRCSACTGRGLVGLWGDVVMESRSAAECQVEVRFPQVCVEGKEGRGGVVWQPSSPGEKCAVMRNLGRALLERFVWRFACRAKVTRALWIGGPLTLEPQPISADSPSGVLETRGGQERTAGY